MTSTGFPLGLGFSITLKLTSSCVTDSSNKLILMNYTSDCPCFLVQEQTLFSPPCFPLGLPCNIRGYELSHHDVPGPGLGKPTYVLSFHSILITTYKVELSGRFLFVCSFKNKPKSPHPMRLRCHNILNDEGLAIFQELKDVQCIEFPFGLTTQNNKLKIRVT